MNTEIETALVPVADAPLPVVITAAARKESVLSQCALIGAVKNPEQQADAVAALREVKALLSEIEKARVKTKEPFLERCRTIDSQAKTFVEPIKEEELRLNKALGDFQQAELEKARKAEAERQAELRRIEQERIEAEAKLQREREEAERQRQAELKRIADEQAAREAEARRVQEEAARKAREAQEAAAKLAAEAKNKAQREAAEKARKAAEAEKAAAAAEKAKQDAILAEQAKAAAAEQARIEAERKAADEAAAAERLRQAELAQQKLEAVGPQVGTVLAKGQTVKEEFDYEVTDIWALSRAHPGFVKMEPIRSEILIAINKAGITQIKGLRIFPVVKNQIRGAKTIDV